jgi:membrane protein
MRVAPALLERGRELLELLVEPLLRFNFIDRSLALGAQAFGALVPLLIVLQAAQPGHTSLADDLIDRFALSGAAADSLRAAFATPTDQVTTTSLSALVLIVSTLSFTRRLQRLYEESWSLPTRGLRGTGWGLAWIAALAIYVTVHPALDDTFDGTGSVILSLAGSLFVGLFTPLLLLGRRIQWQRLLLQASLTAVGLTALGIWTAIYMPKAIGSSAAAYGAIGIAFALLTWLWGLAIVLVVAAVYGSPQMNWRRVGALMSGFTRAG